MERKKMKEKSGFYITVCSCVVIIAAVGYANRLSLKENERAESEPTENYARIEESAPTPEVKEPPTATEAPAEKTEPKAEAEAASAAAEEEKLTFGSPVGGKVIEEFSGDDLVYNEALRDWRAHSGVDFAAEVGEKVVCSAKGVVEDVFYSELGRCVTVNHGGGFRTMYANLDDSTAVSVGDELAAGDTIGTVGSTALGDSTDKAHLHFELSKEKVCVDPTEYLE